MTENLHRHDWPAEKPHPTCATCEHWLRFTPHPFANTLVNTYGECRELLRTTRETFYCAYHTPKKDTP